jgi:hypothetical protein
VPGLTLAMEGEGCEEDGWNVGRVEGRRHGELRWDFLWERGRFQLGNKTMSGL